MIHERNTGCGVTVLDASETRGLGGFAFHHPTGTFALSPASHILIDAISAHQDMLRGNGLDWGTGVGCLAALAARINTVDMVYGLDISEANIKAAEKNAKTNGVGEKTAFMVSDSYAPFSEEDRRTLGGLRGKVDFIVSNPPSSDWDDGFGFRRLVLSGAREFLKKGGVVLLNVSLQYGPERLASLSRGGSGFMYEGLASTTGWVPFDLGRPELLDCLRIYAGEEEKGGMAYAFRASDNDGARTVNAREALDNYSRLGVSPYSKWQTHLFRHTG